VREARVLGAPYRGEQIPHGKKSVALAVSFQSPERTLSNSDAAALREGVVAALRERFGAELRA
jgi:phenylalanyl-tRNA synthetase beta chain